jgi:lysophospholipase L1-like esterase
MPDPAPPRRFARYVAIGDSSTEGLDDPDGRGGYRGWANRLAERLARAQGALLYANLGVRGRRTDQILADQLEPALAMEPDLATVFAGTNDVVARRFDADRIGADVERMQGALIAGGATVLSFTLPDLTQVMPLARLVRHRVAALNEALRATSARTGAILVDIARHPVASDPRLWSDDRLHANAVGHARIAAALAQAIGLDDTDGDWSAPLPPAPDQSPLARVGAELGWTRRHLVPWIWRSVQGRSAGDGIRPKRPELQPVEPEPAIGLS